MLYLRSDEDKFILCDPQTSGGLMIAVEPSAIVEVKSILAKEELLLHNKIKNHCMVILNH